MLRHPWGPAVISHLVHVLLLSLQRYSVDVITMRSDLSKTFQALWSKRLNCITYPEFVFVIKRVEQLDDVGMVAFSQDVDFHHVVLQLLLTFCLDHFGCSQSTSLFVAGLQDKETEH